MIFGMYCTVLFLSPRPTSSKFFSSWLIFPLAYPHSQQIDLAGLWGLNSAKVSVIRISIFLLAAPFGFSGNCYWSHKPFASLYLRVGIVCAAWASRPSIFSANPASILALVSPKANRFAKIWLCQFDSSFIHQNRQIGPSLTVKSNIIPQFLNSIKFGQSRSVWRPLKPTKNESITIICWQVTR